VRRRLSFTCSLLLGALLVAPGLVGTSGAATTTTTDPSSGGVAVDCAGGAKPTITVTPAIDVTKTEAKVACTGKGAATRTGQTVTVNYVIFDGRTGATVEDSYALGTPVTLVLDKKQALPSLVGALTGRQIGDQVVLKVAPTEGLTKNAPADSGVEANDTLVFVIGIVSDATPLKRAAGTKVTPPKGLPTVTLKSTGEPVIAIPKTAAPTTLVVQPLIEGSGPVVKAGQTVTVHYTGVLWRTGKAFDSSWKRKAPVPFAIGQGQVISGWDTGLVGQHVGSQVLLVIPPDQGYGSAGQPSAGIQGTDTLVFVVDILGAS